MEKNRENIYRRGEGSASLHIYIRTKIPSLPFSLPLLLLLLSLSLPAFLFFSLPRLLHLCFVTDPSQFRNPTSQYFRDLLPSRL